MYVLYPKDKLPWKRQGMPVKTVRSPGESSPRRLPGQARRSRAGLIEAIFRWGLWRWVASMLLPEVSYKPLIPYGTGMSALCETAHL